MSESLKKSRQNCSGLFFFTLQISRTFAFFTIQHFFVQSLKYFGHIDGYVDCGMEEIEAMDDFTQTYSSQTVIINVLANDKGDGVRLTQIVEQTQCGEVLEWLGDGEIAYKANENISCSFDSFRYEIEDNCGEKDTADVFIQIISTDLWVEVERDCSDIFETGTYALNVAIVGGVPPFVVDMNGIQDTIQKTGVLNYTICEYDEYELTVIDGMEQEFYEVGGQVGCPGGYSPCKFAFIFDYETTCLGNGEIAIELISEYSEAFYTDNQGRKYTLNKIDTVPNLSYLNIRIPECNYVDTLLNCLSANDDFVEVLEGKSTTFNVLENDFGQEIQVVNIIEIPQCGELLEWLPDGTMSYQMMEGEGCMEDEIVYELANSIGEKAIASVYLEKITQQPIQLEWEYDCDDSNCNLDFTIIGGTAPYSVAGSFNDLIENEFSLSVSCGGEIVLEIHDSNDEILYFELPTFHLCFGYEDCYEPQFIGDYFNLDCLEEKGGVIQYPDITTLLIQQAFYIDSNNQYHELHNLDTIPDHSYYYLELQNLGHIDGYVDCGMEEIEAIDDFAQTHPGEAVSLNVLANDKGDGIRLTQILVSPSCGEIMQWSEDGEVVYVANPGTNCAFDIFMYEIVDNWGEKDAGEVVIVIEQFPELIVETEKDCSNSSTTGIYILNIAIQGETPPYAVNLNGVQDTLSEPGILSYEIFNGFPYELYVRGSLGQEFHETGGELPCSFWWDLCDETPYINSEFTCIENGSVPIEIKSNFEIANYIDAEGVSHGVNAIDTIPNLSYLTITLSNNYVWDTLLNCLSANDDFLKILDGEQFNFNVLENDFGQNIQVTDIIELPQCGELLDWLPNGTMTYQIEEGESCTEAEMIYEVKNDLGEKTVASIHFQKVNNRPMYLDWDLECDSEWQCEISLSIIDGIPPYSIEGYLNEVLDDNIFTLPFECGNPIELEITDNNGEMVFFELDNYYHVCYGLEECYEPSLIHQFLQIQCLSEQGGILQYQPRMIPSLIEQAFYIDSNNQYHELQEFDTIPNHSYYYLKMKYFGHIDGYVDCLMTDIENTGEKPSNISLQLYPNPNNGQFFLQLHTPPTLSLQSFPIRMYDIAGRLIEVGEIGGNRLERLDLENVESGLYLLQVILEEEVLVRRFLVE